MADQEIFRFPTEVDRQAFIKDLKDRCPEARYATNVPDSIGTAIWSHAGWLDSGKLFLVAVQTEPPPAMGLWLGGL